MQDGLAIFRFLRDETFAGRRTVLVTLTAVSGSSARAPGAHMAISESGASIGSFSGGCVEAAVIAEARAVLAARQPLQLRFGAGSPYIDIRLPCGGGIDLLFLPDPPAEVVAFAHASLEERRPVTLLLSEARPIVARASAADEGTGWTDDGFMVRHDPILRLVVLGHGAEPGALLRLAHAYGAASELLSPDPQCVAEAEELGMPATLLRTIGRSDRLVLDRWSAAVMLFHDHDWETDLLLQVLAQQPFFIGAMGSPATHAERRRRLLAAGATQAEVARVIGPVGMLPASRDPSTLAVSVLAQVVAAFERLPHSLADVPARMPQRA